MTYQEELKEKIINLTREYVRLTTAKNFTPGKDKINYSGRIYDEEEVANLVDVSLETYLTLGRYGRIFEEEFSKYTGLKYTILTNSGSSANLIALSSLTSPMLEDRLEEGDEVITTAASFPTTVNPIFQNNLIPVFLDIELGSYNLDVNYLEDALSKKTRAIFIAHTLGNPFNLDKIMEFANKHNLYVIEDACDSLGSKYNGKLVGTFGDMSTYSFFPAHHITMGEGGAVTTANSRLKRIAESIRDWGRDCWCEPGKNNTCGKRFGWNLGDLPEGYDHKYIYSNIGYNLKPTDFGPAFGVAQLKKLPNFIEARKRNFNSYHNHLKQYEEFLILPKWEERADPSWFGYPITVKENPFFKRKNITKHLEGGLIETRLLFSGNIIRQPGYKGKRYKQIGNLKNCDIVLNNTFFIGTYSGITEEKANYILNVFDKFFKTL